MWPRPHCSSDVTNMSSSSLLLMGMRWKCGTKPESVAALAAGKKWKWTMKPKDNANARLQRLKIKDVQLMRKELIDTDVEELGGCCSPGQQVRVSYAFLWRDAEPVKAHRACKFRGFRLVNLHCDDRHCQDAPTTLERERKVHTPVIEMVHKYETVSCTGKLCKRRSLEQATCSWAI